VARKFLFFRVGAELCLRAAACDFQLAERRAVSGIFRRIDRGFLLLQG
jgi:hypothetical protein